MNILRMVVWEVSHVCLLLYVQTDTLFAVLAHERIERSSAAVSMVLVLVVAASRLYRPCLRRSQAPPVTACHNVQYETEYACWIGRLFVLPNARMPRTLLVFVLLFGIVHTDTRRHATRIIANAMPFSVCFGLGAASNPRGHRAARRFRWLRARPLGG